MVASEERHADENVCPACVGTGWISVEWLDRSRSEIRYDRKPCEDCGGGGGAQHYPDRTDGPVRYFPVSRLAGVVGYLWASDAASAADFVICQGIGTVGVQARVWWRARLQEAYDAGFLPGEAIHVLAGGPEVPMVGHIPPDAIEQEAASTRDLETRASR